MSKYMVAFILDGLRKFEPALEIGDKQITYITDLSADAKEKLKIEMGKDLFDKLWGSSAISCIQVHIDADDEESAIKEAWINAKQITNALSLVEFDQQDAISMAPKRSPNIIPNVLVADMDREPHLLKFGHYTPPGLMLFSVNEFGAKAKDFNETIVRHIEKLMPTIIWCNREFEEALIKRLVHSLHWYAIAMNQQEKEFGSVYTWFISKIPIKIYSMETLTTKPFPTSPSILGTI